MKATIDTNETNFKTDVLQAQQPVLVDFWASWCGPCKMIAPVLEEVAAENAGRVKVVKVDVDANPVLAAQYGIQSIPTLLLFQNGEVKDKLVGAAAKRTIVSRLERLAEPAASR